jgi:hypothetical protein
MEDSRTVLRSLSKTKKSYIRREGHDENKALDVNQKEQQEQPQTQQQEYRRVGRKIYNSRKQVVKQDPRNASAQKATKEQLPGEEEITYPYAVGEKKAHKDKTEEELEQERIEMENDIRKHEESYYYSEYYFGKLVGYIG